MVGQLLGPFRIYATSFASSTRFLLNLVCCLLLVYPHLLSPVHLPCNESVRPTAAFIHDSDLHRFLETLSSEALISRD